MDVVFVLDISGSVQEKYDNAMMFARNVTYGLDIDSGNVRVGAVAYSTSPIGQFYLRDYNRREAVMAALRFYSPGGSTNTASALDRVRNHQLISSYGARSGVRKVCRPSTSAVTFAFAINRSAYPWGLYSKLGRLSITTRGFRDHWGGILEFIFVVTPLSHPDLAKLNFIRK